MNFTSRLSALCTGALLLMSPAGVASASVILAVDFGQSQSPSLVETGFSEFELSNAANTTGPVTRTFGDYSVTLAGSAAVNSGGSFTSTGTMTARDRGNPATDTGTFTYNDVYRDFITLNAGTTMGIQLTGLAANTSYAVTFYVYDNANTRSVGFKDITGATNASPNGVNLSLGSTSWTAGSTFGSTTSNEVFSVSGTAVSDSLGRLTFSNTINSGNAFIGGLTLATIPEPSTYALLLGGIVAMTAAARRRRPV